MNLWSFLYHTFKQWTELLWNLTVGTSTTVKRKTKHLICANGVVLLSCLVTLEELYCLNYCQKEVPHINYIKTKIVWGRRYMVLSCSRLNKSSFTYLGNAWGAGPPRELIGMQISSKWSFYQDQRKTSR